MSSKILWFVGGFALGLTLISVSRAAIPKRATPSVSEIQANKLGNPDFEQDYQKLTSLEGRYAESWDQQQRLRKATQRVASGATTAQAAAPVKKKARK